MSEWRTSDEEEKYFAEQDRRLRLGIKADIQRSQAQLEQALAVAKVVGSDDPDIGDALTELGFSVETARVLFYVPLLQVAWADGKMGFDESSLILDSARAQGLSATSPAYARLDELTRTRPSEGFFTGAIRVCRELVGKGAGFDSASTLDLMNKVAGAQGGFLGFGNKVSDEEKAAIDKLVRELNLSR